jgi:putative membrane-bound dehydrogenase-like protein
MAWMRRCGLALLVLGFAFPGVRGQSEYGFVNTRPSGQPYLSPDESLRRLRVPPGWEVKLFAAEPDIINPISFTVDERGRLWVVECYEYPKHTPPGRKARDRIKILEDTTGAGRADKVTVWAEGKDLPHIDMASGIEVGYGGVFLGAAPYLLFLRDSTGAGRCDKVETLLSGFGSQDTHEVLNTLQWGPDGRLYGLQGIFTHSEVGGVRLDAAVWRYDLPRHKFDIFAEGTSNPWGLDFDPHGQAFLTACVIPHAFHIIPGGTYIRQAGTSLNPYAYGLLHEISDHLHHAESGWAHAGALVLQGDQIPPELRNSLLMGSIHGCSIKRDVLERRGSTFVARHAPDFLVSGDKNFRPINMRWGPDGSIYVIDWHDQNPCHQAAPDSWDMTHGRIYKIQRKSTPAPSASAGSAHPALALGADMATKSSADLVEVLKNNSPWWHRTALRLLKERGDRTVAPSLEELALSANEDTLALRGLWGLYGIGAFDEAIAVKTLLHASPWVRSWTVRLLGEAGHVSEEMLERFARLAKDDPAPEVRLQLASTAQRLTGQDTLPLLHSLMEHAEDAHDPCLPLMIWLAYEPRVPNHAQAALDWLKEHAVGNPLITEEIVPRTLRRLVATGKPEDLAACVTFLGAVPDAGVRRKALDALVQALQSVQATPPNGWRRVFAALLKEPDSEVRRLARRLAVKFHDAQAVHRSLQIALDSHNPLGERLDAVRDLAVAHPSEGLRPLEDLLLHGDNPELRGEVCRTLAAYDDPSIARMVLTGWASYPPAVRVEAVNLLAGRKSWASALLAAVGRKAVPRSNLNDNTILRIRALHDRQLDEQITTVWGRVRETTSAELNALINRMRHELAQGRGSIARGRKVFENQCAKCHRFEGKGHDVGPNLAGAARDIDYLLVNVLDPNRVVGQPYFTRFIVLKNGRVETGLLAAEDSQAVTLKTENDALKVIPRKDIEELTVQEKSLMPEGLDKNLSVQDFRDLVRYLMANPFLTDVRVAGPFVAKEGATINPADPLADRHVEWTQPVVGPPGRIPLPPPHQEGEATAYVAADVTAPVKFHTQLLLGAASPVSVWLNGKTVYQGKPGNGLAAPDQIGVDVQLRPGVNHLLFRITYRGNKDALYARLVDPERKLQYPEVGK